MSKPKKAKHKTALFVPFQVKKQAKKAPKKKSK